MWYLWGKKLTREDTKCQKMTEREFYGNFYSLNKDELNMKVIKMST